MDGRKDGWMDGQIGGRIDGWMDGWRDGWKDGWRDRWMEGRMEGWVDEGSTHGRGLGAAPEGGEDSEDGLCADNKLLSSEEGESSQGHAGPSGQSNCREPSRLSVAAGEPSCSGS